MSLRFKYFTLQEAEALIPEVNGIMSLALQTKNEIERKVQQWRDNKKGLGEVEEAVFRGQVDFLASQLEDQLARIAELGCIPKNLDMGLVDFPARVESKEGFLCWKIGEEKITHWHGLTEGFKGRKPLKREA